MAIEFSPVNKLADPMKHLDRFLPVTRILNYRKAEWENELSAPIMQLTNRYPRLLYGAALSTGSGASDIKATDQLDQAQEVSADPRILLQTWSN